MTTFSLFLVVILVEVISGWVGTLHLPNHRKIYKVPSLKATDGDTDIFASLRTRVAQVSDRQSKLPVVVLDTMLPRQVLRIKSADPIFIDLIRSLDSPNEDGSTFAMIGLHAPNRSRGDWTTVPMKLGVEVELLGAPQFTSEEQAKAKGGGQASSVRVSLRAGRRLRLAGRDQVATSPRGWTEARVVFLKNRVAAGGAGGAGVAGAGGEFEGGSGGSSAVAGAVGGDGFGASGASKEEEELEEESSGELDEEEGLTGVPPSFDRAVILATEFTAVQQKEATTTRQETPAAAGGAGAAGGVVAAVASVGGEVAPAASTTTAAKAEAAAKAKAFFAKRSKEKRSKRQLSLVEQWVKLARIREKSPGQIDRLLIDLAIGSTQLPLPSPPPSAPPLSSSLSTPPPLQTPPAPVAAEGSFPGMPPPEEPSALAFWVGALINPLPGMGVSLEIRPQFLTASSPEERVRIALDAIRQSIGHMEVTKPLW